MRIGLVVTCSNNGRIRDAGIHETYDNMEEANAKVPGQLQWLRQMYQSVQHKLIELSDSPQT